MCTAPSSYCWNADSYWFLKWLFSRLNYVTKLPVSAGKLTRPAVPGASAPPTSLWKRCLSINCHFFSDRFLGSWTPCRKSPFHDTRCLSFPLVVLCQLPPLSKFYGVVFLLQGRVSVFHHFYLFWTLRVVTVVTLDSFGLQHLILNAFYHLF